LRNKKTENAEDFFIGGRENNDSEELKKEYYEKLREGYQEWKKNNTQK